MVYFIDEIRRNPDAGEFDSAFDSVPHKELISKLKIFGFEENSIKLVYKLFIRQVSSCFPG